MPGRTVNVRHQSSITIAGILWTGALCGAWHHEQREDAMHRAWLAAAVTATIVAAMVRTHARDVSEAHWSGFAAGKKLSRPGEAE